MKKQKYKNLSKKILFLTLRNKNGTTANKTTKRGRKKIIKIQCSISIHHVLEDSLYMWT